MDKRFFLFIVLASLAMLANVLLMNWLNPPPPPKPKPAQQAKEKPDEKPGEDKQPDAAAPNAAIAAVEKPAEGEKPAEVPKPAEVEPQPAVQPEWVTLGSADPAENTMLVTFTNLGAAVERIELSSPRMRDQDETAGYLGHLVADASLGDGAKVRVVGRGTPAAKAGLQAGDVITALGDRHIGNDVDLRLALRTTRPGQKVSLKVRRGEEPEKTLTATLGETPLEVVRPEGNDPLTMLFTLERWGEQAISRDLGLKTIESPRGDGLEIKAVNPGGAAAQTILRAGDVITHVDEQSVTTPASLTEILERTPIGTRLTVKVLRDGKELNLDLPMPSELPGFALRTGAWEIVERDETQVAFRWRMAKEGVEIIKRYRLPTAKDVTAGRDYHLMVNVQVKNIGSEPRKLAYQLDGATGLPIEGWWFGSKISRNWGGIGVRDVAVSFRGENPALIGATTLLGNTKNLAMPVKAPLVYAGIDAQYVAAALLPQKESPQELQFADVVPLRVGPVPSDKARRKLVNTSVRLVSKLEELAPGGAPLEHEFVFFAGPKRPDLLAKYELGDLVYYGWFGFVAEPMLAILHFFYSLVHNYGLAIIMLTVMVRGVMFPLSRKQAISAQKMQELQPEIKKLAEKYKNNMEARNKAQQELFKKHNYNPLGGCFLMFFQLPIFIGLYRSLMVDVELRQAPLIPGIRWCSNLAAPDMLFRWKEYLPSFLGDETGWLGPYFNLLPIFTIALFLWQQKMFMPPATDEQTAMQQKMIKYMMVFMGVMFFKVASGLCIYFIASSLWGIAERKLLPKTMIKKTPEIESPATSRVTSSGANGNGAANRTRKKQRGGK